MQDLHESWGERLGEELKEQHLSYSALARACGVHDTTILRIVRGEICPNDELKWKIAGALGLRMDRLWAWPAVVPPKPAGQVA